MTPDRSNQIRGLQTAACVVALVAALAMVVFGIVREFGDATGGGVWLIGLGILLAFLAIMGLTYSAVLLKIESHHARQLDLLRDAAEAVRNQQQLMQSIAENTRISDAARALAHREQELAALRSAIREDIREHKWEAALYLVNEIERRFGYKEEADGLREEVDTARNAAIDKKLNEAVQMIESHFDSQEWDRAQAEIERLMHALPDHSRVTVLMDRMKILQEDHKKELRKAWDDAVQRSDTDRAIDVLRQLDRYLSPAEVRELQDSARTVFKDKLLQLGVSFQMAVNEHRWQDALGTGMEIIRDFPNARMANEVREAMETLRERARLAAEAAPS